MSENFNPDEWRRQRRTEFRDRKDAQFYIFCEGEKTEPNYFKAFKKLIEKNAIYKDMVLIQIEGCATDTVRVLDRAEKYVKENGVIKGQVWCVYDLDSFNREDFDKVLPRMDALNKSNAQLKYYAGWSNQCVEYWFLLHFGYYTSDNHRTEYIKALNEQMKKAGRKYRKNDEGNFDFLLKYGDPRKAIKYAEKRLKEEKDKLPSQIAPGTNVQALVKELAKYLPSPEKEKFI